jgi:hypothetical protein
MRLGPTLHQTPDLQQQRQHRCSKCNAEFSSLQVIKINDKQLCIWCAGHPEKMSTRALTVNTRPMSKRRVVYKNL